MCGSTSWLASPTITWPATTRSTTPFRQDQKAQDIVNLPAEGTRSGSQPGGRLDLHRQHPPQHLCHPVLPQRVIIPIIPATSLLQITQNLPSTCSPNWGLKAAGRVTPTRTSRKNVQSATSTCWVITIWPSSWNTSRDMRNRLRSSPKPNNGRRNWARRTQE